MAPWWWFLREPKHVAATVGILGVLMFLWFYDCVHHCGTIKSDLILLMHGTNMKISHTRSYTCRSYCTILITNGVLYNSLKNTLSWFWAIVQDAVKRGTLNSALLSTGASSVTVAELLPPVLRKIYYLNKVIFRRYVHSLKHMDEIISNSNTRDGLRSAAEIKAGCALPIRCGLASAYLLWVAGRRTELDLQVGWVQFSPSAA
jgi:hypothetical protein